MEERDFKFGLNLCIVGFRKMQSTFFFDVMWHILCNCVLFYRSSSLGDQSISVGQW